MATQSSTQYQRVRVNRYGEAYTIKWIFWPRRAKNHANGKVSWKMFKRVRRYNRSMID